MSPEQSKPAFAEACTATKLVRASAFPILLCARGREAAWLRFATAFNWCQWVIPVVGSLLLLTLGVMAALGLPRSVARAGVVLGLVCYGLWLHWFIARHALSLSRTRAICMVLGVNLVTVLLVLGPRMALLLGGETGIDGK